MLELAGIFSLVVMAKRGGDQTVVADGLLLEAFDSHGLPGTPRSRIRSGERPMELDAVTVDDQIVHEYLHVRQGDVKAAGSLSDRGATDGWRPVIDGQ